MKKILAVIFTIFILSGICRAQEIEKVFVDSKTNYDTVAVNLSSRIEPKVFKLKNPDRLVVDFQGAFWKGAAQSVSVKSDRISTVRLAQNSRNPDNVRIVIDLIKSADNKIFISDDGKTVEIKIGNLSEKEVSIVIPTEEALGSKRQTIEVSDEATNGENLTTEESSVYKKPIKPALKIKVPSLSRLKSYSVVVNGAKMDLGKTRYFIKNVLMVPAKDLFTLLGYSYIFDPQTKTFTAHLSDEVEAIIKQNEKTFSVNGFTRALQAPAYRINGKFHVPLISVVKWVGYGVYWDKAEKTLFIAPRIKRIAWEEKYGTNAVVIESSALITTYEVTQKEDPVIYVIILPNYILDVENRKIPVKKEGVIGIKSFQAGNSAKIGIYLEKQQTSRLLIEENLMAIIFPPLIESIKFTEEAESIRIAITSTKPVSFEAKRLVDPERIIIDIPGAVYNAENKYDIDKGGVSRIRASQFKTDPYVSRIVLDLSKELLYKTAITDDGKNIILRIKKERVVIAEKPRKIKILKGKVIAIDPGHGGSDPGAFGFSGESVKEKDLNLSTATKLAKLLSEAGAVPLLSREDDATLTLPGRVEFAKSNKADIFVCVHYNSSDRRNIYGTETYYYNDNSKLLASIIHKSMISQLGRHDRGLLKVKFYVIYHVNVPSVLVEPVYINNEDEEKLAINPDFQEKIAKSVFDGIVKYFEILKRIN